MVEDSGSNTAMVVLVVILIAALVAVLFFWLGGEEEEDAELELDVETPSGMIRQEAPPPADGAFALSSDRRVVIRAA